LWGGPEGVRAIEENGLFLGKFTFATYSSIELPHNTGDRILLYTDGIPETTNPEGVEFAADRFKQFLETEQNISTEQFADQLLTELARWSARGPDEDLDDDITIVAIRIR
jgi:serine phosphatase RsbU (regulator of sigma subunit)